MVTMFSRPSSLPASAETTRRIWPDVPQTIDQLGIPMTMVVHLVLQYVRDHGTGSLVALRKSLKLSYPIVQTVFDHLRKQQLLEVTGLVGKDYSFTLTTAGRNLAAERADICRYGGPAPVPLHQYANVIRAQCAAIQPTREALRQKLGDLVLTDELLDQLGPALISQRALFLYGPTGNGKTSVAERLPGIYEDVILIPYAVEVDGHIISVFDPVVHWPADSEPDETIDPRWVRCRRPCVLAGGELTQSMLELRLDESSGVYAAPLQMKANNGLFIIDDFGRQATSPQQLLSRWIVPLDRHVDYLSLRYGVTFQIPFELMVVFSTNLDPADLADEAFLRRIPNKIYVEPVSPEVFDTIFERVIEKRGLPSEPGVLAYLRGVCEEYGTPELRACYPGDICNVLTWIAAYERRPIEVTRENLTRAAKLYFMKRVQPLKD